VNPCPDNAQAIEQTALAVPLRPGEWLAERRARLDTRLKEFGRAARTGTIPGGIIENGKLHIDKLRADTPEGAEDLVLDLYQQLRPRGSPICCWKSMSEPDFPRRSRIAHRRALQRPDRPDERVAGGRRQSRFAQDGGGDQHAQLLGIAADRALACRRQRL
jgi:hypothetical protein